MWLLIDLSVLLDQSCHMPIAVTATESTKNFACCLWLLLGSTLSREISTARIDGRVQGEAVAGILDQLGWFEVVIHRFVDALACGWGNETRRISGQRESLLMLPLATHRQLVKSAIIQCNHTSLPESFQAPNSHSAPSDPITKSSCSSPPSDLQYVRTRPCRLHDIHLIPTHPCIRRLEPAQSPQHLTPRPIRPSTKSNSPSTSSLPSNRNNPPSIIP